MADEDQDLTRSNLEPPKLFGRKSRPEPEVEAEVDAPVDEPTDVLPVSDPTWMFELPVEAAAQADLEPALVTAPDPEAEPGPEHLAEPSAAVLPAEAGVPIFADEVEEEPAPAQRKRKAKPPKQPKQPKQSEAPAPPDGTSPPRPRVVAGWVAASLTGVVVGLLLVGATAGSLHACEAVRGTATCGGTGVPILLLIMAAMIAIGGVMLRLFHVPDPGSTSFLAVGMVAVIALLFLLDFLLSPWMLLVIPLIAVAMYLLAFWVTTAFVEPAKEPSEI